MTQRIKRGKLLLLALPLLAILFLANVMESSAFPVGPEVTATMIRTATPLPTSTRIPGMPVIFATPTPTQAADVARTRTSPREWNIVPLTGQYTPSPDEWKSWPVLPEQMSSEMLEIYKRGLRNGNNPHAFSIVGDCQSEPELFLGEYDRNPLIYQKLTPELRETALHFSGSFDRISPTVRNGSTAGAILWQGWTLGFERTCNISESPLDCELRIHKPSIVIVHIGTHWEARNHRYLTKIVETIKAHGAVPIMATKADNRELDERINRETIQVAAEQGVPVWNFWAAVQHLPNNGLQPNSDMYLSEEALMIHRDSALQLIDLMWRTLNNPN